MYSNNPYNPFSQIASLKQAIATIRSGNTDSIMQQMMQNNPQFRSFVQMNKGKSTDEILRSYGVNADDIKSILQLFR